MTRIAATLSRALLCGAALALAAGAAPAAFAKQPGRNGQQLGFAPPTATRGDAPLSLDQAVARVRRDHPKAEIVSAETRAGDGGPVHVIKILRPNGKLKVIRIDAGSGAARD